MLNISFNSVLIIAAMAVLVPLISGLLPRLPVPGAALEVIAGILIGPAVLGWVRIDAPVQVLSDLGLGMLLFLAGLEIDIERLRGPLARLAVSAFAVSVVLALLCAYAFRLAGQARQPIMLLSLFFSATAATPGAQAISLAIFIVLVVLSGIALAWVRRLEPAGRLLRIVDLARGSPHPQFRVKLEGIGFGFLVPIFFISTGVAFPLKALLANPAALAEVPLFLLALLLVRGLPALLYTRFAGRRRAVAAGLLQATTLTFVIVAAQIGLADGKITPTAAASLLTAGLLSAILFPAAAQQLLPRAATAEAADAKDTG